MDMFKSFFFSQQLYRFESSKHQTLMMILSPLGVYVQTGFHGGLYPDYFKNYRCIRPFRSVGDQSPQLARKSFLIADKNTLQQSLEVAF